MSRQLPSALLAPWAITQDGLEVVRDTVHSYLTDGTNRADIDARVSALADYTNGVVAKLTGSVAVINIAGPLTRHASILQIIFGASSYEGIAAELGAALQDPSCSAIVLNVDSPGGEVAGVSDLSKAIYEARGSKPIKAYVSGNCASAALWLASAADEMVIAPTAQVGSIGVRALLVDRTEADKAAGLKKYDIVSAQSPNKVVDPSDSADRARVRANLSAMAAVFIEDVARNRAVSTDRVIAKFGQGDLFVGADAVTAGLADRVGSLDEVIASLTTKPQQRGYKMTAKLPGKGGVAANVVAESDDDDDDMECDGCSKSMSKSSKLYCSACMKGGASFVGEVLALLGVEDHAKALGTLAGLKAEVESLGAAKLELELLRKIHSDAKIAASIDEATKDGRVKPAKREELLAFAAKYGADALEASLGVMSPKSSAAVQPTEKQAATTAAANGFNADQLAVFAKMGIAPEKIIAHNAARVGRQQPIEGE